MSESSNALPLLQQFGSTIRQARKKKHITLRDLQKLTNISVSYLGQIERGERNPTLLVILQIADALGERPSDLLNPLNPLISKRKMGIYPAP